MATIGWTHAKVGELLAADFDGSWGDESDQEIGIAVLRSTDMRGGTISFSNVAFRSIPASIVSRKRLVDGDILVNKSSGSAHLVGASVLFFAPDSRPYLCSNFTRCVRPDSSKVIPEYLYYSLQSPQFRSQVFGAQRTTSGLRNLKLDEYKAGCISYPSRDEQSRIVARINECMERVNEIGVLRIESLRERSYLSESLIEAELQSLDGSSVHMSDVAEITSSMVDPRNAQYQSLLHVGGANIESKTGRLVNVKTAAEENLKSGKFTFDQSMVLYNKIRPYLMKSARPEFSGLCSADMYPLSPKAGRITRDFLYYVLMSRQFTDYAISGSNRAGMPKVNREHLFAYSFTLPSLEVQERITAQLDNAVQAVLDLESEMTTAQTETTVLRDAILRKAFAGEL